MPLQAAAPRRAYVALACLILMATAAACGESGRSPTPAPFATATPAPLTAIEAIGRAREAMAAASSFKFRIRHEGGATVLPGNLALRSVEGAVLTPDRIALEAGASMGRAFVRIEIIVIGNSTYMTNPLTGNWSEIDPEESPITAFDPAGLIADILRRIDGAKHAEPPTSQSMVIEGDVGAGAFTSLVPDVDPALTLGISLNLSLPTFRVTSAEIRGPVSAAEEEGLTRYFEFWDIDAEISVEPPI